MRAMSFRFAVAIAALLALAPPAPAQPTAGRVPSVGVLWGGPITFATGPAARYNPFRSLTGLAVALVLVALAFFLARTTDWRKPTEADTPELDRAVLTD